MGHDFGGMSGRLLGLALRGFQCGNGREFESGRCLKVRFDQGVTYWRVRFGSHRDMWFDFDRPVEDQVMQMAAVIDAAQVQNSEQKWATDVLVELQR